MKTNAVIFISCFVLALGGGYLIWGTDGSGDQVGTESTTQTDTDGGTGTEAEAEVAEGEAVSSEAESLVQNNCLSCHAVESLNLSGGTTGPDLSNAYAEVEGKHGISLDEFLKEPTSAVMSTVIEGDPLTDEERESIVEALRIAAEK